jgi:hypothetical protein
VRHDRYTELACQKENSQNLVHTKSVLEYVDHLHEHFVHPSSVKDGYYATPLEPGYPECGTIGTPNLRARRRIAKTSFTPPTRQASGCRTLSTIDYVVVTGKKSVLEYVDHLHEHFVHPSSVKDTTLGPSIMLLASSDLHQLFPSWPGYSKASILSGG